MGSLGAAHTIKKKKIPLCKFYHTYPYNGKTRNSCTLPKEDPKNI